ncbi:hypothetical protein Fcan01_13229 [Folsomia candida]|uniref:Uncharacterized protein n=2 Tax=Folsomia candida TaxID=158441 RepID=A0A226E3E9_FOLCA|nr:hypothetical protein Fcan01_13229 [Folsomia candida]
MERDAPLTTRPTATENASNETTINDSPRNFAPPAACSEKLNSPGTGTPPMSPTELQSSPSSPLDTDHEISYPVVLEDCDEYQDFLVRNVGTDPYNSDSDSDSIEIIYENISRKSRSSSLSLHKDGPIRSSPQLDTTTNNDSTGTCSTTTDMLDEGSKESEDTHQAGVNDDVLAGEETEIKMSDQTNLSSNDPPCTFLSDDNAISPIKSGFVPKEDSSEDIGTEAKEMMPPSGSVQLIDPTQQPEVTLHTNEIWDLDDQSTFFELPEGWEVIGVVESALTEDSVVGNDISSNSLTSEEHGSSSIGEKVNTFLDSLLSPEHQNGTQIAVLRDINSEHVDSDLITLEHIHPQLELLSTVHNSNSAGVGWAETLNSLDLGTMKGLQGNDGNKLSSWSDSDFISQTIDHEEVIPAAGTECRNSDNGENEIPIIKKYTKRLCRKSRKQRDREHSAVHLHIHNFGGELVHPRPRQNSVARALKLIRQSKHKYQNIKIVRMTRKRRRKKRWAKTTNQNARKSPDMPTIRNILSDEDSEISVQKEQPEDLSSAEFWRLEWTRSRELYSNISEVSSPQSSANTPPPSEVGEAEEAQVQPDQVSPNMDSTGGPYSTTLQTRLETLPEEQQVSTALLDRHAMSSSDGRMRYAENSKDSTHHEEIRPPATVTLHYPHEPIIDDPLPSNHPPPLQIWQQTAHRPVDSPPRPHAYTPNDNEILQQHITEYRKKLSQCNVCMKSYSFPSVASLCLRTHGKSKCWICFMLISFRKGSFAKHNKAFHPFGEKCGFCPHVDVVLEINLGFRQHMERDHFYIPDGLWSVDLKEKLKSKRGRKITKNHRTPSAGGDQNNENEENKASESCSLNQPLEVQIETGAQQQQSEPGQNFENIIISHRRNSKEQMSCMPPIKPGGQNNGDLINLIQNHPQSGRASECVENDNPKVSTTSTNLNSQTNCTNKYWTSSTPSQARLPELLDDPRQGYISVIVPNTRQQESTCNAASTSKGNEAAATSMNNYHANQSMNINNYNQNDNDTNEDDQEREIIDSHATSYSTNCQNSGDALNDRRHQYPGASYHDYNRHGPYQENNYPQGPTSQDNNYNQQHRYGTPVRFISQNQAQVGGPDIFISNAHYPYQICTRDSSPYFCPPILNNGNRFRNNQEVQLEQDWNLGLEISRGNVVVDPSSRLRISMQRPFETYPSFHATAQNRAPPVVGQAPPGSTASNYNCANKFVGRCKPVLEAILNGAKVPILLTPLEINTVSSAISTWFSTITRGQFLKLKQVGPTVCAFIMSSANLPRSQEQPLSNDFWECLHTLNNWLQ